MGGVSTVEAAFFIEAAFFAMKFRRGMQPRPVSSGFPAGLSALSAGNPTAYYAVG